MENDRVLSIETIAEKDPELRNQEEKQFFVMFLKHRIGFFK